MQSKRISKLKEKADQALESGELSEEAQDRLISVLTPDAHEQTWPDVEVVLHVAEHAVVAAKIRKDRLPERLETALVEAFSAVLPLLGTRAFGPLYNVAERARKRLDAERRKYEMVAKRLDTIGEQEADVKEADVKEGEAKEGEAKKIKQVRLLRNYLSTEPAPLFVARFRQQHAKLVDEAERQSKSRVDLALLVRDSALIEALVKPGSADANSVQQALARLVDHPDVSQVTLRRALADGNPEQTLAAAAVATFDSQADFAPAILSLVLAGSPHAPQLAVMAARLAPLMARQVLSQFLAEAAWQNPEEPEAKITAERTHAILSARCVLPKIGSPLEEVDVDELPDSMESQELQTVPRLVEDIWDLWEKIGR
jgi:hypothetical protein